MFKVSIVEQQQKFMDMLSLAVYGLDSPDQLIPALKQLGRRHAAYGVKPEDYYTVETALLWMLEEGLEGSFTSEMKVAWQAYYKLLADLMLDVD